MTKMVRHFVEKRSSNGRALFYWQPSAALRRAGWTPRRLEGPRSAAIAEAEALNEAVDRWRGDAPDLGGTVAPAGDPAATGRAATPGSRSGASMTALVDAYRASRFYPKNAATRRHYEWAIGRILEWTDAGTMPVAALGPRACNEFYETLLATGKIAAAGQVARILAVLLEHAVRAEMIAHNPARRMGLTSTPARGVAFPREAVRAFVATADALGAHAIGTAIVVNYWLGQRPVDIRVLPRSRYRDGTFWIRQQKTRAYLPVPHSPLVQARVEAELARQDAGKVVALDAERPLIVNPDTGRAYSESGFSLHWREVRDAVAAKRPAFDLDYATVDMETGADVTIVAAAALQFRDLRPTAVTELAIAGCQIPQIAAISGHSLSAVHQIIDRYLVRNGALATAAAETRLAWEKSLGAAPVWTPDS